MNYSEYYFSHIILIPSRFSMYEITLVWIKVRIYMVFYGLVFHERHYSVIFQKIKEKLSNIRDRKKKGKFIWEQAVLPDV